MTSTIRTYLTVILALVVSVSASNSPTSAQPIRVLAYDTAPFFTQTSGQPSGLEWEILQYFGKARNRAIEVEFVANFEELLPMLADGKGDVVAATVTITPERETRFDFSGSYFPVRVVLVESKSVETRSLNSLTGAHLATMKGTTYEELISEVPEASFVYGGSEGDLMDLVASGEARAAAMDSAVALTLLPRYPELHMTLPLTAEQHYGFVVAKGSPLAEELSEHLVQLKNSKIYFRLLERYFGKAAVADDHFRPTVATSRASCQGTSAISGGVSTPPDKMRSWPSFRSPPAK